MIKFPTTLVFVDDHTEFLKGLKTLLEPLRNPMVFFNSPLEALEFINDQDSQQIFQNDFWTPYPQSPEDGNGSLALLKHNHAAPTLQNSKRFRQISCVISDFDMLEMDGIELFSKTKHPHIRKILLTGVASHEYGVTAFNSGSINQFLQKDNPYLHQILQPIILDQEQSFFMNFNFQSKEYSGLSNLLKSFEKEKGILEKYRIDGLGSKLFINEKGEQWIMGIFTEESLESQLTQARDFDASHEVIEALEKKKKAFGFYPLSDKASIPEAPAWDNHMHPIDYIPEDKIYYSLFRCHKPEDITCLRAYCAS